MKGSQALILVLAGLAACAKQDEQPTSREEPPAPASQGPAKELAKNVPIMEKKDPVKDALETPMTRWEISGDITLYDLLSKLSRDHKVTFVIANDEFQKEGRTDIKNEKVKLPQLQWEGWKLQSFLDLVLTSIKAAYIVRPDAIEITTLRAAREKRGNGGKPK